MAIKTRQTTATGVTNNNAPLTNDELDNNFVELQQNKYESGDNIDVGTVTADGLTVDTDTLYVDATNDRVGINTSPDTTFHVLGDNQVSILAGSNASTTYHTYKYNTSTVSGYIGNGSSILTGANNSDFIVRSQADLVFASNGNNRTMTLDTSGNVGIGTTSPSSTLHVSDSASQISIQGTAGTGTTHQIYTGGTNSQALNITSGATSGNAIYHQSSSHIFRNQTGATEYARIDSSGNLGINCDPSYKLEVQGDVDTWVSRIYNTGSDANASGLLVRTDATAAHDAIAFGVYANSGYEMVVRSTGNVGINTTSPTQKLEVNGAVKVTSYFSGETSANTGYFDHFSGTTRITSKGADGSTLGAFSILQQASDGSPASTSLHIDSNGWVGINDTSPSARLHVNSGASNEVARFESTDATAILRIEDSTTYSYVQQNGVNFDLSADHGNTNDNTKLRLMTDGSVRAYLTNIGLYASEFQAINLFDLAGTTGNSYDRRVILLAPLITTNTSHQNRVNGRITMAKTGGNVCDFFDVYVNNVYNDNRAAFISHGQRTTHKFVSFDYDSITWLGIEFGYTANPYNEAYFIGQAITDITGAADHQLKVISYEDVQSGSVVLNQEIYDSIQDYSPNGLAKVDTSSSSTLQGNIIIDKNTPRIDFRNDASGSNLAGRIESNENGNLWINAQGGKDLWLNWLAPTSPASYADLQVGNGNSGYVATFQGSTGNVGINTTSPQKKLDVKVGANEFVTVGAGTFGVGSYAGIHFGYSEAGNANYRKSAIVFERTDLTTGNAQGKVHILNGPQSGSGSATLSDAKLTIAEDGDIGIGTTAPSSKLNVLGETTLVGTTSGGVALNVKRQGTSSQAVKITNEGGDAHTWFCYTDGSNYITGDADESAGNTVIRKESGGTYTTIATFQPDLDVTFAGEITVNSDERIKKNIEQIDGALEKVQAIRGVTFERTDGECGGGRHVGVIAQEVEKVLPEVVKENEETGIKSVAYGNMVGLLIEAIKEQQTQIDDLKAEVTRLKGFE